MIQLLSVKYKKGIACALLLSFYLQIFLPLFAAGRGPGGPIYNYRLAHNKLSLIRKNSNMPGTPLNGNIATLVKTAKAIKKEITLSNATISLISPKPDIGGPSSPESHGFKAVGSDNLVNLFTGDFSYSIPLLDVGGYPVNLFYSGGIGMEQEASWVGLGWNINPGTVSRNMRGVPDDFNGEDSITQKQNTKPNRTWGGEVGINGELIGIPQPNLNLTLGFSHNNYQGPALEVGASVSLTIPIFENVKGAKAAPTEDSVGGSISLGLGAKLNSRSGLTISPSLNAGLDILDGKMSLGVGLSTSYNSRVGIKDINLSTQTTLYRFEKDKDGKVINQNKPEGNISGNIGNSSFSFARPSYTPTLRMPMENANYSGQLELGGGFFGIRGGGTASGYYSESKVPAESRIVRKPLVGFLYSENANNNKDAVMDFNRVNDAEVTPRTPIISAPQYSYDIFNIQGEGTGGSIRAYRGDMGFMRDNLTASKDKNISIGFDIAPGGHFGGNWNIISMPTRVGGWDDANNTLTNTMAFKSGTAGNAFENIYFKNPGEATVNNEELLERIGGDDLVRFKLGGTSVIPRLESKLERFNKKTNSFKGIKDVSIGTDLDYREKRTQVISMLTAYEASKIGLERQIRSYTGTFDGYNNIVYDTISRFGGYRKTHHISEIDVLEQSGMRYIYGLPVYSIVQKDFTFTVNALPVSNNLVSFSNTEPTIASEHTDKKAKLDGYVQVMETPAYASSFLLTGLLSPDYVDVTGNGITEDDHGGAVKFNYTKSSWIHKWRTPRNNVTAKTAHFNEGLRTEKRDNKATISYGEREVWYLNSIESKAMVAIFKTDNRDDGKGVIDTVDGRANGSEQANKKLTRIDLYMKAEIKAKGINGAKPQKSVIFEYDNSLCSGTPDNYTGGGKLTLKSVSFAYYGQTRASKERYVFNYGNTGSQADNPSYAYNASDRWGTYKAASSNPSGLTNADYPYTSGNKTQNDEYAAAWSLKKILLPSGGQMEIQYEADDYGYVQNRRAANMYTIFGLGKTPEYSTGAGMYNLGLTSMDNFYVYVQLPQALTSTDPAKYKEEIYAKYLEGINQLAFKLLINMPKGPESLTVYSEFEDYGLCPNSVGKNHIYVKLKPRDGKSPLAKSAIGFLTESLPAQAFGYVEEVDGLADFLEMVTDMLGAIREAFKNVDEQMRDQVKARTIVLGKSFIRLNNSSKIKYGGGIRVKKVLMKDNWNVMTGKYASVYGQDYDYTTIEKINNKDVVVSSGVASYEPGIGSEENPFREIISFSNKMPLASAIYGAIEMPMLEALYPAPSVGYSKITVRSIHRKGTHGDSSVRSAIGKQVTEFFTARDYPTYSVFTPLSVMDYNKKPHFSLFYKEIINRRTLSQGFLVETNDMHGKMKSQLAYSESDENTPLSASYHSYKNTGRNGFNDKVDFVYNTEGGNIRPGNMGIDVELMTDVREFRVTSNGFNGQIQVDIFSYFPPIFMVPFLPLKTYMENKYRAVTCTKLINYHAIEDSVIVIDKGSMVTTKKSIYDSETGTAILTQTGNEFKDPVYTANYPAYWAYSGVGSAYRNIGYRHNGVTFYDGRITAGGPDPNIFESGDELYIISMTPPVGGCAGAIASPNPTYKVWVLDKNKSTTSLIVPVKDLMFIDATGKPFTANNVSFKIIRSGRRNQIGFTVSSSTSLKKPVQAGKLVMNNIIDAISATATEYKEKWSTDCIDYAVLSNPYRSGMLGNFKPHRNYIYYGERMQSDFSAATAIRKDGIIANFSNYWNFNVQNNLVPSPTNPKWVCASEIMKTNTRGLELETKNALKQFTAAQYGFFKNLPVAIAQNSRQDEMAYEGFEEFGYNESINESINPGVVCNPPSRIITGASIVEYTGASPNPYGVAYNVVNNGDGTQTLTVSWTSTPPGTTASTISYFNGGWINNTGSPVSPRSIIIPVGNWQYQLTFQGPNPPVVIPLDGSLQSGGISVKAHSGTKMLRLPANSRDTIPLYINGTYPFNSDSIRFNFPTGSLYTVNTYGGTPGVNGSGSITQYPGGTWGPSLGSTTYYGGYNVQSYSTSGGSTFNGSVMLNAYYIPTQSTPVEMYLEGQVLYNSCGGAPSLSVAGGGITIYDMYNNVVASGGTGGGTVITRYPIVLTNHSFTVGQVYRIQSNLSFYGSMPSCSWSGTASMNIINYVAYKNTYTYVDCYKTVVTDTTVICSTYTKPIEYAVPMANPNFGVTKGKRMVLSAWVREDCGNPAGTPCYKTIYDKTVIELRRDGTTFIPITLVPTGNIIDGWQKIEGEFTVPNDFNYYRVDMILKNIDPGRASYFDDIRIHPFNSIMKSYVYDRRNLRMSAELDENNHASFYEYDEEGQLIRVKKETVQGIKTVKESRNAKQKSITSVQ
jgi:hypothetical protein